MISTVAPLATGLPISVSLLADSLPRTPTPRFDASTFGFGSFTSKVFPSTVWSAAPARDARTAVTVRATARAERRMCMTSPGTKLLGKNVPGVAGTRVPATPRSLLTAADPARPGDVALDAHRDWTEGTRAVVERHLLTAGGGVRRPVLPVEARPADRVVVALLEDRRRRIDRPEGRDGIVADVLQADELARRRRLQLLDRARLRAREVRVARGVGAGKPQLCVEVEAADRRWQRAPHGRRRGRARGRGGRRARRRGGRGAGRARAGLRRRSHDLEELVR